MIKEIITHSVHDHAADLQDGHVGLLTLVPLPHDSAHPLQAGVGAVQPGNVTLQKHTHRHQMPTLLLFKQDFDVICRSEDALKSKDL